VARVSTLEADRSCYNIDYSLQVVLFVPCQILKL